MWQNGQTDLACKFVLIMERHLYTQERTKAQELSLEELLLIFVVGLIAYPKYLLAGNDLSNMTEIITVCCCLTYKLLVLGEVICD